jgi:hypothetical protein
MIRGHKRCVMVYIDQLDAGGYRIIIFSAVLLFPARLSKVLPCAIASCRNRILSQQLHSDQRRQERNLTYCVAIDKTIRIDKVRY